MHKKENYGPIFLMNLDAKLQKKSWQAKFNKSWFHSRDARMIQQTQIIKCNAAY
jgi:hypothetical protein